MQDKDCNHHAYLFENLLVLKNTELCSDKEWFAKLQSAIPNWTPDTRNELNRTVLVQDKNEVRVVYALQIWNNIACCKVLYGSPLSNDMDIIIRYLRHTIKTNVPDERLAKECNYKLFAYLPKNVQLANFKSCASPATTILTDPAPSDTTEWLYHFSPVEGTGTNFQSSLFAPSQPQNSLFNTGNKPFSTTQPTQTTGFHYGGQQSPGTGFGGQQSQGTGFGSQQSPGTGFGGQQNQGTGFGSQQSPGTGFGGQQNPGTGFGGQQNQTSGFGSQQSPGTGFQTGSAFGQFKTGPTQNNLFNTNKPYSWGFGQK